MAHNKYCSLAELLLAAYFVMSRLSIVINMYETLLSSIIDLHINHSSLLIQFTIVSTANSIVTDAALFD